MTFVQFKCGDIVKLVSGGPAMVVNKIMGDRIECRWFDGMKLKSATFPVVALQLVLEK